MLNAVDRLLENWVFFRTESKAKVNGNIPYGIPGPWSSSLKVGFHEERCNVELGPEITSLG